MLSAYAPPSGHAEIWAEVFSTAMYIHKRMLTMALDGCSSYEMLDNVKLDLAELQMIGMPYAIVRLSKILEDHM